MFKRTVTRNGKQYTYWQHSIRKGKGVKSLHLGKNPPRLQFLPQPIPKEQQGWQYIERWIARDLEKEQAAATAKTSAQTASQHQSPETQEDGGQQGTEPSSEEK